MPAPIVYSFQTEGAGNVVSAIRSIRAAAEEAARAQEGLGRAGAGAGRAVARGAGAGHRGLTEVQRLALRVGAAQERAATRAASAMERAATRGLAATKRAEEQRWREVERTGRRIQAEMDREVAAAERAADRKARAEQRARSKFLANPMGAVPGLARAAGGAVVGLGRDALRTGAHLVGGAVRESMETQAVANRVSINARGAGQDFIDPTVLRKEFERTAIATRGTKASDVGKAVQAYVDLTGDIDTARSSMKSFATVASATGATIEDVATAAASLGPKFDVKSAEDMQAVFATLVSQGKEGAMTMKDLAGQFQKLAAAGAAFDIGKGPQAVAKLGGLVQIARGATRSPQQAGTAVENIFSGLTSHTKNLHQAGVSLYDKKGGKRDIEAVLAETITKVGGTNMERKNAELLKIFGKQGIRGINPLLTAYTDATKGMSGKAAETAGYEAVMSAMHKATQAASDWAEVERDAAQAQSGSSAQIAGAWERLKAAVGDRLAPAFSEIAGKLASDGKALDMLVDAAGLAADGLKALAAYLQEKGLVSGGSAAEKAAAATAEERKATLQMEKLGGEHGEKLSKLTPEQQSQYNELNAKKLKAREAKETNQAEASLAGAEIHKILTSDKWGGKNGGEAATDEAYKRLGRSPWTMGVPGLGHSDWFQGLTGETAAQREVRHAGESKKDEIFRGSVTKANAGDETGTADSKAAADAQLAAAKELSAAAQKLAAAAQPSITGAPVTPGAGR